MYHFPGRRAVSCQRAAAIYIVGAHTHRDTDAQTMRNTAAYYGKDAACVL